MIFSSHVGASFLRFKLLNKMPELEQKSYQRQIAYKVSIFDILNGNFTKDEFSAGYINLNGLNISRTNIIATIVYKSDQNSSYASAVIDDGTGRISLRSFENNIIFSKADIGDVVLVIGKIREFNSEKYIIPEIIKKINNFAWMNVRKLELRKRISIDDDYNKDEVKDSSEEINDSNEEVYSLIKKIDKGEGVPIDDIIKSSNNSKVENIINKLLENGEIFEIKPGMVKVLE